MILDPATYACPTHHTDLTDQVLDQVEDDGDWPFAYNRRRNSSPKSKLCWDCPENGVSGPTR
jgi:hypothetical protein